MDKTEPLLEILLNKGSESIETARQWGPCITAIGGGTGLSTMLRGIKEATANITAIVTVSDDGGSSGILRQDQGMLPPGDIRNCVMALANTEPIMEQLLNYRFTAGTLGGHSFGNLFLAALNAICPSFDEAVARMNQVLAVTGRVLPVTTADTWLEAEFENGAKVLGESKIFYAKKEQKCRISHIKMIPENAPALPDALTAIEQADLIVLGPGSLYTSVIPNLLVQDVAGAIRESKALRIYVCNIMTQEGETEGYTAYDHVHELLSHGDDNLVDVCLVNSAAVPEDVLNRYEIERAWPVIIDRDRFVRPGFPALIERPLYGHGKDYARHDPSKLAYEIFRIFCEKHPREGVYEEIDAFILQWLKTKSINYASYANNLQRHSL